MGIRLESDFFALVMYEGEINFLMQDVCAHVRMGGAYGYYSSCSRRSDQFGVEYHYAVFSEIDDISFIAINIKSLDKNCSFIEISCK